MIPAPRLVVPLRDATAGVRRDTGVGAPPEAQAARLRRGDHGRLVRAHERRRRRRAVQIARRERAGLHGRRPVHHEGTDVGLGARRRLRPVEGVADVGAWSERAELHGRRAGEDAAGRSDGRGARRGRVGPPLADQVVLDRLALARRQQAIVDDELGEVSLPRTRPVRASEPVRRLPVPRCHPGHDGHLSRSRRGRPVDDTPVEPRLALADIRRRPGRPDRPGTVGIRRARTALEVPALEVRQQGSVGRPRRTRLLHHPERRPYQAGEPRREHRRVVDTVEAQDGGAVEAVGHEHGRGRGARRQQVVVRVGAVRPPDQATGQVDGNPLVGAHPEPQAGEGHAALVRATAHRDGGRRTAVADRVDRHDLELVVEQREQTGRERTVLRGGRGRAGHRPHVRHLDGGLRLDCARQALDERVAGVRLLGGDEVGARRRRRRAVDDDADGRRRRLAEETRRRGRHEGIALGDTGQGERGLEVAADRRARDGLRADREVDTGDGLGRAGPHGHLVAEPRARGRRDHPDPEDVVVDQDGDGCTDRTDVAGDVHRLSREDDPAVGDGAHAPEGGEVRRGQGQDEGAALEEPDRADPGRRVARKGRDQDVAVQLLPRQRILGAAECLVLDRVRDRGGRGRNRVDAEREAASAEVAGEVVDPGLDRVRPLGERRRRCEAQGQARDDVGHRRTVETDAGRRAAGVDAASGRRVREEEEDLRRAVGRPASRRRLDDGEGGRDRVGRDEGPGRGRRLTIAGRVLGPDDRRRVALVGSERIARREDPLEPIGADRHDAGDGRAASADESEKRRRVDRRRERLVEAGADDRVRCDLDRAGRGLAADERGRRQVHRPEPAREGRGRVTPEDVVEGGRDAHDEVPRVRPASAGGRDRQGEAVRRRRDGLGHVPRSVEDDDRSHAEVAADGVRKGDPQRGRHGHARGAVERVDAGHRDGGCVERDGRQVRRRVRDDDAGRLADAAGERVVGTRGDRPGGNADRRVVAARADGRPEPAGGRRDLDLRAEGRQPVGPQDPPGHRPRRLHREDERRLDPGLDRRGGHALQRERARDAQGRRHWAGEGLGNAEAARAVGVPGRRRPQLVREAARARDEHVRLVRGRQAHDRAGDRADAVEPRLEDRGLERGDRRDDARAVDAPGRLDVDRRRTGRHVLEREEPVLRARHAAERRAALAADRHRDAAARGEAAVGRAHVPLDAAGAAQRHRQVERRAFAGEDARGRAAQPAPRAGRRRDDPAFGNAGDEVDARGVGERRDPERARDEGDLRPRLRHAVERDEARHRAEGLGRHVEGEDLTLGVERADVESRARRQRVLGLEPDRPGRHVAEGIRAHVARAFGGPLAHDSAARLQRHRGERDRRIRAGHAEVPADRAGRGHAYRDVDRLPGPRQHGRGAAAPAEWVGHRDGEASFVDARELGDSAARGREDRLVALTRPVRLLQGDERLGHGGVGAVDHVDADAAPALEPQVLRARRPAAQIDLRAGGPAGGGVGGGQRPGTLGEDGREGEAAVRAGAHADLRERADDGDLDAGAGRSRAVGKEDRAGEDPGHHVDELELEGPDRGAVAGNRSPRARREVPAEEVVGGGEAEVADEDVREGEGAARVGAHVLRHAGNESAGVLAVVDEDLRGESDLGADGRPALGGGAELVDHTVNRPRAAEAKDAERLVAVAGDRHGGRGDVGVAGAGPECAGRDGPEREAREDGGLVVGRAGPGDGAAARVAADALEEHLLAVERRAVGADDEEPGVTEPGQRQVHGRLGRHDRGEAERTGGPPLSVARASRDRGRRGADAGENVGAVGAAQGRGLARRDVDVGGRHAPRGQDHAAHGPERLEPRHLDQEIGLDVLAHARAAVRRGRVARVERGLDAEGPRRDGREAEGARIVGRRGGDQDTRRPEEHLDPGNDGRLLRRVGLVRVVPVDEPVDRRGVLVEENVDDRGRARSVDAAHRASEPCRPARAHGDRPDGDAVDRVATVSVGERPPAARGIGSAHGHDGDAGRRREGRGRFAGGRGAHVAPHGPRDAAPREEGDVDRDALAGRPHVAGDRANRTGDRILGEHRERGAAGVATDVAELEGAVGPDARAGDAAGRVDRVAAVRVRRVEVRDDDAGRERAAVAVQDAAGHHRAGLGDQGHERHGGRRSADVAAQVRQRRDVDRGRDLVAFRLVERREDEPARELAPRGLDPVGRHGVDGGVRGGGGIDDPVEQQGDAEAQGARAGDRLRPDDTRGDEPRALRRLDRRVEGEGQRLVRDAIAVGVALEEELPRPRQVQGHPRPLARGEDDAARRPADDRAVAPGQRHSEVHRAVGTGHEHEAVDGLRDRGDEGEARRAPRRVERREGRAGQVEPAGRRDRARRARALEVVRQGEVGQRAAAARHDGHAQEVAARGQQPGHGLLVVEDAAGRRGRRGQAGADRGRELAAGVGRPQELVEPRVGRRIAAPEVVEEVPHGVVRALPQPHAEAGFGEGERLLRDLGAADRRHVARQGASRRVGDAPRLAEDPHGRPHDVVRQEIDGGRQEQRVRRERHAPLADADVEGQRPGGRASSARSRVEAQIARDDLAREMALERERERLRPSGSERRDLARPRLAVRELEPAERVAERDVDEVAGALSDVRDGDVERERLVGPHDRRRGERHAEGGVPDEDAALGASLELHGADREPVEHRADVERDGVEALGVAAHREVRDALLARREDAGVVARARGPVGPDSAHRQLLRLRHGLPITDERGQRERRHLARAGSRRQLDAAGDVVQREARARRRAVRDEQLRREELLEVADVAGDDEDAGDAHRSAARRQVDRRGRRALDRGLGVEEHGHDRRHRDGDAGARRRGRRLDRLGNHDTLSVEDDRHREGDDGRFELQAEREREAQVVARVPQVDPAGLDLLEREGTRLDGRDQDLLDHLQRDARGLDIEDAAPARDEPQVRDPVVAGRREPRNGQQEGIGGRGGARVGLGQRQGGREAGARELGLDFEGAAEKSQQVGRRERPATGTHDHAHRGGRVLRHDRRRRLAGRAQAEEPQLHLADLAKRRLRESGGRCAGRDQEADRRHGQVRRATRKSSCTHRAPDRSPRLQAPDTDWPGYRGRRLRGERRTSQW